jgi:hypothetical protein
MQADVIKLDDTWPARASNCLLEEGKSVTRERNETKYPALFSNF